ncbi:leucine-rich repeats and immunoglobulin-like domains protein 3 [Centruroides vittatus]|uniref:leucine-rich repeats and immunoglobulin-like domains protein 3 n=1 Tax=Centruroides vittatus TaxID=120091 RepID=UPI00350EC4DD
MKLCLIFLMSVLTPIFGLLHRCPQVKHFPEEQLKQKVNFFNFCHCQKHQNSSVFINCQNLKTRENLTMALNFLRGYFIDELTIRRSSSLHLTAGTFKGLHIEKLIFDDTRFETLILFSAFKGLEFELHELHFLKCRINNIVFQKGTQFTFLNTLIFEKTNLLPKMSDNVFKKFPSKLRNLKITGCNVQEFGNQALKKLSHLETADFGENHLTKISRSMFPRPARRLRYLSLTSNPITELPDDLFENMERLEFLLLSDTRISVLSNNTFFPVWQQLEEVYMNNIKLNCDCNISWMLEKSDASIIKKPFCISHNRGLNDIRNPNEICPARRTRKI